MALRYEQCVRTGTLSYYHCVEYTESFLSCNDTANTSEDISVDAAGKVKACHHLLQVSNIYSHLHVAIASETFANKISRTTILQICSKLTVIMP